MGLYGAGGLLIDYVSYGSMPVDHSVGRFPDGTAEQRVLSIVTAEAANDHDVSQQMRRAVLVDDHDVDVTVASLYSAWSA